MCLAVLDHQTIKKQFRAISRNKEDSPAFLSLPSTLKSTSFNVCICNDLLQNWPVKFLCLQVSILLERKYQRLSFCLFGIMLPWRHNMDTLQNPVYPERKFWKNSWENILIKKREVLMYSYHWLKIPLKYISNVINNPKVTTRCDLHIFITFLQSGFTKMKGIHASFTITDHFTYYPFSNIVSLPVSMKPSWKEFYPERTRFQAYDFYAVHYLFLVS